MTELYVPPRFHIPAKAKFIEGVVELKVTASAKYKIKIIHPRGTVTEPFGDKWLPNLIPDSCFNDMMNLGTTVAQLMTNCRAGTSSTAPANSDTAMNAYWASTSTATGSGASSTNDTTNGACTHVQSYDFAAAGSGVTLNELGLSRLSANSAGLTTHALFPSAVILNTGDVLRVVYSLTFSIPATVTQVAVSLSAVNGFNISGNMKVCGLFSTIFGALAAAGTWSSNGSIQNIVNASTGSNNQLDSAPTVFPSVNTSLSLTILGNPITGSQGSYTAGTFTRNQTFVWVPSNPSTTVSNVNGILLNSISAAQGLYLILTAAQTKANTNTLTVVTSATMARG